MPVSIRTRERDRSPEWHADPRDTAISRSANAWTRSAADNLAGAVNDVASFLLIKPLGELEPWLLRFVEQTHVARRRTRCDLL